MAFTVTDDHARQQEVWQALGWDKDASTIRRMLTEGQVAMTDRRAVFVGDGYADAGGAIVRDLFDDENGGYLADAALLDRLVLAKLECEVEAVRTEGWAWVMVAPEFDHRATSGMRRVYPTEPEVSAKTQRKIKKLSLECDAILAVGEENGEMSEEMETRLHELGDTIGALKGEPVYGAADIAAAGAFVSLGFDGGLRVERGFVRKADEAPAPAGVADTKPDGALLDVERATALPEKLVAQLTAHRTAALREAVAGRPDVAFVAVVHALVASTFYVGSSVSSLDLKARTVYLSSHAPGIDESPLGRACADRQAALALTLPDDVQDLWQRLQSFSQEQLMQLLAHCAALTIDGVVRTSGVSSEALKHADTLAQAVSLDMTAHWQATAANYLGQVTKAVIVDAVREGVSPQAADNIAAMKKPAMAEAAEGLLAGKGWLPQVLRVPQGTDRAEALAA